MRILLSLFTLSALSLMLFAVPAPAAANSDPQLKKSDLPASLRYLGSNVAESWERTLPYRHRSRQIRSIEAPTRYRTQSILRYSQSLGATGLVLRVKLPLKPRKIVKLELRF